jgi:hypothetical protein
MKKTTLNAIRAMASPPPPPTKRSRKTLIAIILIILIVVLAVGVYLATRGNGNNPNPSATPTPTPTPITGVTSTATPITGVTSTATPKAGATPTPTAKPTSSSGPNVAGATSLQFTSTMTNSTGHSIGTYTYYAKNAGTSNLMIRIEYSDPSGDNFIYIVNGALQQAWVQTGGQWTDLSSAYSSQWSTWNTAFTGYQNSLANWAGVGDYTYTSPNGDTVRIYNISVNPSLADSLFQHS